MNSAITKKQIKMIHVLVSALGLSDEEYRLTLFHNFRVDTSKALSLDQAGRLIDAMKKKAIAEGKWNDQKLRFENLGSRLGMATPAQLRKIEATWKEAMGIRDLKQREKGLRTWLERKFKISDLRFIPEHKVRKIVHALNAIKEQNQKRGLDHVC